MDHRSTDLHCVRIVATTLLGLVAAAFAAPAPAPAAETHHTPAKKAVAAGAKATRPVPARSPAHDTARRAPAKDIDELRALVRVLQGRLAATSNATDRRRDALLAEHTARVGAEQDAQRLRETLPRLQTELLAARRGNSDLHQEVTQIGKQLSTSEQARAVARLTIRALNARTASLAPELQTTRDALTAAQAASRDAAQRAAAAEARGSASVTALAELRKELVLWIAGAGLLSASCGGLAARMLSPRPGAVGKPITVSAKLGEWAVASAIEDQAAPTPFRIRTHWLPGRSDVVSGVPPARRPNITALHGTAA